MLRVFWKGKSKRKISVTAISEKKLSGRGILCTVWIAHWNRQIWSCQHPGRLEETVQEGLRSFLPNSPREVGKNSGVLLIAGPLCIETQDQGNEIHCNSYSSPRTKSPAHAPPTWRRKFHQPSIYLQNKLIILYRWSRVQLWSPPVLSAETKCPNTLRNSSGNNFTFAKIFFTHSTV